MVTILSSHQQNAMVSTLSVLFLTLNKALPGGRPWIGRVSLMVRLIFSLNKFQGSLVLKTGGAVISFPPFCLNIALDTSISVGEISRSFNTHIYLRSPLTCTQHRTNQNTQGRDEPELVFGSCTLDIVSGQYSMVIAPMPFFEPSVKVVPKACHNLIPFSTTNCTDAWVSVHPAAIG